MSESTSRGVKGRVGSGKRASRMQRTGFGRKRENALTRAAECSTWSEHSCFHASLRHADAYGPRSKGLTRVDKQFIHDLKSMVVLPNLDAPRGEPSGSTAHARLSTSATPAVAARQIRRTFSRHESKNSALIPGEKDENIHLYLSSNQITKLPRELWTLENLKTLSLSRWRPWCHGAHAE